MGEPRVLHTVKAVLSDEVNERCFGRQIGVPLRVDKVVFDRQRLRIP